MEEGQCIVDEYNDWKHEGSTATKKITPEKKEILSKLEHKIQAVIAEFGGKAFVRLSTRRYSLLIPMAYCFGVSFCLKK